MISFDCTLTRGDFRLDAAFTGTSGVTGLFGPSGSGKTTIIRLIAGIDRPDRGRIAMGDAVLTDTSRAVHRPPHRRRVGLVFQDAQLFPHLSVRQNLRFGRFFTPPSERRVAFEPVVEVLGLGALLERAPRTLSGGERQRVAIGRALLASPRLLLMDEPLASLDMQRKLDILPFIERMRDEFAIPIVYVSHAVEEVARLAASVVKLAHGRVVGQGRPEDMLSPALERAAERFDAVSIITGTLERFDDAFGLSVIAHPAGDIVVPGRIAASGQVRLAIHATDVTLAVKPIGRVSLRTQLSGRVADIAIDPGPFALVTVELVGGERLHCYTTRLALQDLALVKGGEVEALVKAVAINERGVTGAGG